MGLELPAEFHEIALRQFHAIANARFQFGDDAAEIAAGNITADDRPPADVVPIHLIGTARTFRKIGHVAQANLPASIGQIEAEFAELAIIGAIRLAQFHHEIESTRPVQHLRNGLALERRLHEFGGGRPTQPVEGQIVRAENDVQLVHRFLRIDDGRRQSARIPDF